MKKFICSLIICLIFVSSAFAITKDDLYRRFGPRLLHAIVLVIKDEINILRTQHGLAERTNEQLINAIDNKLSTIEKYDWME